MEAGAAVGGDAALACGETRGLSESQPEAESVLESSQPCDERERDRHAAPSGPLLCSRFSAQQSDFCFLCEDFSDSELERVFRGRESERHVG